MAASHPYQWPRREEELPHQRSVVQPGLFRSRPRRRCAVAASQALSVGEAGEPTTASASLSLTSVVYGGEEPCSLARPSEASSRAQPPRPSRCCFCCFGPLAPMLSGRTTLQQLHGFTAGLLVPNTRRPGRRPAPPLFLLGQPLERRGTCGGLSCFVPPRVRVLLHRGRRSRSWAPRPGVCSECETSTEMRQRSVT